MHGKVWPGRPHCQRVCAGSVRPCLTTRSPGHGTRRTGGPIEGGKGLAPGRRGNRSVRPHRRRGYRPPAAAAYHRMFRRGRGFMHASKFELHPPAGSHEPARSRYKPEIDRLPDYQQQQRPAEIASSCSSVMFGSGGNARMHRLHVALVDHDVHGFGNGNAQLRADGRLRICHKLLPEIRIQCGLLDKLAAAFRRHFSSRFSFTFRMTDRASALSDNRDMTIPDGQDSKNNIYVRPW